jgi:hypothetical protein
MIFEWNENKREINAHRHKLDLIDGQYLFCCGAFREPNAARKHSFTRSPPGA